MPLNSPEIQRAITKIHQTIRILDQSASGWAANIRIELDKIERGISFVRKEAFTTIGGLCHPMAMGDTFVHGMTNLQWVAYLDSLREACVAAFNLLEREFGTLSEAERLQH